MPVDPALAAAFKTPLVVIVFSEDGQTYTRSAPGLPQAIVGLALADLASKWCRDYPATLEQADQYEAEQKRHER